MLPDALLYDLSLAATINGFAACGLLTAATVRRNDRLLRIGAGAALATAVVGAVAVRPPARWTDFGVVGGVVTGLPALGAGLCLFGYDRHRALAGLGILLIAVGLVLSIPAFGERFVAP